MTKILLPALFVLALFAAGPVAHAGDDHAGPIKVSHPWIRATAPGAATAAGYVTLTDTGHTPDRLVSASSPWAHSTELHRSVMSNGVMSMHSLPDGVDLAAGRSVSFAPGGYHIMFVGPIRPAKLGERIPVTLTFAHAAPAHVTFLVESGASDMSGMKMPGT